MKKVVLSVIMSLLAFYIFMAATFCVFGFYGKSFNINNKEQNVVEKIPKSNKEITLLKNKNIIKLNLEEYLYGVVAAEMPASFEVEALKAQAVAARTYTVKKMEMKNDVHPDAVVCDDINHCKAYSTEEELKAKYGDIWITDYYPKIKDAVNQTSTVIATYNNEPISAVFHSTSSGETENSKDVWGGDLPYLVSVKSEGEEESPRYYDEVKVPLADFKAKMLALNVALSEDKSIWIGAISKNKTGSVNTVTIGNVQFKGTKIRELFALRSTNFEINVTDDAVVFKTKGNGHGVGMSQYGANHMAKMGYTYDQILKKYYTGIELKKD